MHNCSPSCQCRHGNHAQTRYTENLFRRSNIGAAAAAIVGTLTNTIGYLGLASLIGYMPWAASLTVMVTQMPFEMVLAVILIVVLNKAFARRG